MNKGSRFRLWQWSALLALVMWSVEGRAQLTPQETRTAASAALSAGAYEEAIVHLRQLVDWYGESTQQGIIAVVNEVFYNLGLSYLFTAQFGPAEEAFTQYMERDPHGPFANQVAVLLGDVQRFQGEFDKAIASYEDALPRHGLSHDLRMDAHVGIARGHLAEDRWGAAIPSLQRVFRRAPDMARRNWAATMLAISFLQERRPEALYPIMTVLLQPESFTSRSVRFNLIALEVADEYFIDEDYRTALWLYRLVYPHDTVFLNSLLYQERITEELGRAQRNPRNPRPIMRIQETLGDIEAELEALAEIENYDPQLFFRVARAYMENMRYREARDLFSEVHAEGMEEYAEQALYLALVCAFRTEPVSATIALGERYMEEYPDGIYYADASLLLAQVHATLEDWPQVLAVGSEALAVQPQHIHITELLFMLGYASFMEEQLTEAIAYLLRLNVDYPQNERYIDAEYWLGMAHLFDGQYEGAIPHFLTVMDENGDNMYREDATFRHASCVYALGDFDTAEQLLLDFVEQFPGHRLQGEAYVMLGDTAGARGDIDEALARFRRIPDFGEDVNIELYNYAAFRKGEMLDDRNEYGRLIRHFEAYIDRAREGGNIPQALYWVGHGYWQQDQQAAALDFYLDAIRTYGSDRLALGIDLILEDWVGKSRAADPELQRTAWRQLERLHDQAMRERDATLAMRLKRIMMFDPHLTDGEIHTLRLSLRQARLIPFAALGNLEFLWTDALGRDDEALLQQVADELVTVFPETDTTMEARLWLGERALAADDTETALQHFEIIRTFLPGHELAAQAIMHIGHLHRADNRWEEADTAFQDVLGVREWRRFWPEALYYRGQTAEAQRALERAAAFYERIYVLYGGDIEWAARAYWARAQALQRLREYEKAAEVLEEFTGNPELADQPDRAAAEDLLRRLRRRL